METKFYLDSQTIRGAIIAAIPIIAMVLKLFGIMMTEDEINLLTDYGFTIASALMGIYGIYMVVVGRWKAETPLRGRK